MVINNILFLLVCLLQNFKVLVDRVGLSNSNFVPLEFFHDKHLLFPKKEDVRQFEVRMAQSFVLDLCSVHGS